MRRELPPMNALLAFEAAARHGNFTRAAAELLVAQPAVTRHIANLESWMGASLFSRNGSSIELTNEGKIFSELTTAVLDRLELGTRQLRRSRNDELVVGASFGIAHLWVMPRISEMRNASGKNINLVTSDDYSTFDNSAVDFSIRFGNGDFGDNCADLLLKEKCQIIASPKFLENHPAFNPEFPAGSIDPVLMFDHGDPNGVGWMDWQLWHDLTNSTYPGNDKLTLVQSYPTMLDMVCAGEGISIGTIGIEDDLLETGRICGVGPTVSRDGYGYFLVYQKELLQNQAFARLRDYMTKM